MIFQRFLKGITGVDAMAAQLIFNEAGIQCNWWRNGGYYVEEIPELLTEANILQHLSSYHKRNPATGQSFGHLTPFISTTAGGVERDAASAVNLRFSAFLTALGFATKNYKSSGAIFYGYLNVLGRKSVALQEFAEETRELNLWTDYQPYHRQGEILAKIVIPPAHLEKAEIYDGPDALQALRNNTAPKALVVWNRTRYVAPEKMCNVRDVLM